MRYYNINKTKGGRTTRNLILTPKSKKVRGTDQKEHNLKPEQNLKKVRGTDHRKLNLKPEQI